MVSPTQMSAAGVSLDVNTDMVRLSSEEFPGIGPQPLMLQQENPSGVSYRPTYEPRPCFMQADTVAMVTWGTN